MKSPLFLLVLLILAAPVAQAVDLEPQGFGSAARSLSRTDAMIDAAHRFYQADANRDLLLGEEEFTSHLLAKAQLVRLGRVLHVKGRRSASIVLPKSAPGLMLEEERVSFEAAQRRSFHMATLGTGQMGQQAWVESQIALFDLADGDGDRVLSGDELDRYSALSAGVLSAAFSGI